MESISITELDFFVKKGLLDHNLFESICRYKINNNEPITADEADLLYKEGFISEEKRNEICVARFKGIEEGASKIVNIEEQQKEARMQGADVILR